MAVVCACTRPVRQLLNTFCTQVIHIHIGDRPRVVRGFAHGFLGRDAVAARTLGYLAVYISCRPRVVRGFARALIGRGAVAARTEIILTVIPLVASTALLLIMRWAIWVCGSISAYAFVQVTTITIQMVPGVTSTALVVVRALRLRLQLPVFTRSSPCHTCTSYLSVSIIAFAVVRTRCRRSIRGAGGTHCIGKLGSNAYLSTCCRPRVVRGFARAFIGRGAVAARTIHPIAAYCVIFTLPVRRVRGRLGLVLPGAAHC